MERRRFNQSERAALFLASDGKCEECGDDLKPGWHGDHITPYSAGGITDVINGQALCPPCNIKKGNRIGTRNPQINTLLLPISNSSLQEHICSDGHPDWGDGTDCLNCGGGTKGTTN